MDVMTSLTRTVDEEYQRGRKAFQAGDLANAKRALKRCVIRDPKSGRSWELLGQVHYRQGNYPLAVSALERAERQMPLQVGACVCLGRAYGKIGQVAKSIAKFNQAMADNSVTNGLLLEIALGLDTVHRPDLSIEACRRVLKRDPMCAQAYYDMGYYSGRCGTPPRTAEFLARRAVQCEPSNIKYRIGLSGLLYREGRLDEAYEVVRDLGLRHIASVSCVLCLQRLVELFGRSNDARRVALCDQRLTELRLQGCSLGY